MTKNEAAEFYFRIIGVEMPNHLKKWFRDKPLTKNEVAAERTYSCRGLEEGLMILSTYTCDACKLTPICKLSFDPYNTNGDCLLAK